MANDEARARDIGCTGTLVITINDRCHHAAWLRDRRDRPTRAPADERGDGLGGRHRHLYGRGADRRHVQAAGGRSICHRPGKVTSAAERITVKAVRVHDRRVEGRAQAVIQSIWPPWCHTSPGAGQVLRPLRLHNLSSGDCDGTGAVLRLGRGALTCSRHAASGSGRPATPRRAPSSAARVHGGVRLSGGGRHAPRPPPRGGRTRRPGPSRGAPTASGP